MPAPPGSSARARTAASSRSCRRTARRALRTVVCVGDGRGRRLPFAQLAAHEAPRSLRATAIDLAALIYTSGSTGEPKGVTLTHQNMTFAAASLAEYLEMQQDEVVLLCLPLSFDYGLYQLLMTRARRRRRSCSRRASRSRAASSSCSRARASPACRACRRSSACCSACAASATASCPRCATSRTRAPRSRSTTIAGLRETFPQARIYSMYGLTECKRVLVPAAGPDRRQAGLGRHPDPRHRGLGRGRRRQRVRPRRGRRADRARRRTSCRATGTTPRRPPSACAPAAGRGSAC